MTLLGLPRSGPKSVEILRSGVRAMICQVSAIRPGQLSRGDDSVLGREPPIDDQQGVRLERHAQRPKFGEGSAELNNVARFDSPARWRNEQRPSGLGT